MRCLRDLLTWGFMALSTGGGETMGKYVLARVQSQDGGSVKYLPFYECAIDVLLNEEQRNDDGSTKKKRRHEIPCTIRYDVKQCSVTVGPRRNDDAPAPKREKNQYNIPLLHAGEACPMRRLTDGNVPSRMLRDDATVTATAASNVATSSSKEEEPHVHVATSVLVMSRDDRILLTRRSPHLRSFPSTWVVPGGHVDPHEPTLESAAARELREETGIRIEASDVEVRAVYESAYPATLEDGMIKRRHLIVYMVARLEENHGEVETVLEPGEVCAAAWLALDQLRLVFSADSDAMEECRSTTFGALVNVGEIEEHGEPKWERQLLPLERLRQRTNSVTGGLEKQRISTGVKVAIQAIFDMRNG